MKIKTIPCDYSYMIPDWISETGEIVHQSIPSKELIQAGVVEQMRLLRVYNDMPRLYAFAVDVSANVSGMAVGIEPVTTQRRAWSEAVERWCLTSQIPDAGKRVDRVDPRMFCFAKERLDLHVDSFRRWGVVTRSTDGVKVAIPSQLISAMDYGDEPLICQPGTSGSGCASTYEGAREKALFELVERDAFVRAFTAKLGIVKIHVPTITGLPKLLIESARRYGFDVELYQLDSWGKIPVVLATLADLNTGKIVVTGTACVRDPRNSAAGAIFEAWMIYIITGRGKEEGIIIPPTVKEIPYQDLICSYDQSALDFEYFSWRAEAPILSKVGYEVVKVISPSLVPMFLSDRLAPVNHPRFDMVLV